MKKHPNVHERGIVTLTQIESFLPTIANFDMNVFNDLVRGLVAQIGPISLNVTTPAQRLTGHTGTLIKD
jgi:hypothetical protein